MAGVEPGEARRVAVLISGSGSNLQSLIDAASEQDYPADIRLVISNNPDAFGLERARRAGIATAAIDHRDFEDRPSFEAALSDALDSHDIDLVCLAGFMRILTASFTARWEGRMLNIHPSLLPDYKGLHTHRRALEDGRAEHGCSVHFVQADLDAGPVIIQAAVPVLPDDTPDSLAARVLTREHAIYPLGLALLASGQVALRDGAALSEGRELPIILRDGAIPGWREFIAQQAGGNT